jgi:hypothetical protein
MYNANTGPQFFPGRVLGDSDRNSSPRVSVAYKGVNIACKAWFITRRPRRRTAVGHATEGSGPFLQALGRWMQDGELRRTKHGLAPYRDRDILKDMQATTCHQSFLRTPSWLLRCPSARITPRFAVMHARPDRMPPAALNRIVGLRVDVFDQHRAAIISLHRCASMNSKYPCGFLVQPQHGPA